VSVAQVRGGFVSYRYNGLNDYTLIIEKHRDTTAWTNSGGVYFHDSLGFPILYDIDDSYMMDVDTCSYYLNGECVFINTHPAVHTNEAPEILTVLDTAYNSCKIPLDSVGFRRYLFERNFNFDIPDSGLYILYSFGHLNNIYKNLPLNEIIHYQQFTYIPPISRIEINSAPVVTSPAIMYLCLNELNSRGLEFYDPENDSLSVELYHLYRFHDGGDDGLFGDPPYPISDFVLVTYADGYDYQNPIPGTPSFNINPSTFEITSMPSEEGAFIVGLKVNEWRNGELINYILYNIPVFVRSCGNIEAHFTTPECSGLDIEVENLSQYSNNFLWDFGIMDVETDTSSVLNPSVSFPETGEYEITLIAEPGSCADTLIQNIVVSPPVDVQFVVSEPICSDGQWLFGFQPTGAIPENTAIDWTFSNGTPQISQSIDPVSVLYNPNQIVNATIAADNSYCNSLFELELDIPPYPFIDILEQQDPCPGYTILFEAETVGANSYLWSFGDADSQLDFSNEMNTQYQYSSQGDYLVLLTINEGTSCEISDSTWFNVLANEEINMLYDINLPQECSNSAFVETQWLGNDNLNILWEMGDGSFYDSSTVTHTYSNPGEYIINLTANNLPCPGSSSEQIAVQIQVTGLNPNDALIFPNVFTPGKDTLNNYFRPVHPQELLLDNNYPLADQCTIYDLKIFNRNGQIVFQSENDLDSWNGVFLGNNAQGGTYFYTFTYQLPCMSEPLNYSGYLYLIRE